MIVQCKKFLFTCFGKSMAANMLTLSITDAEVESEPGKGTAFTVTLIHKIADEKYYDQKAEIVVLYIINIGKRSVIKPAG